MVIKKVSLSNLTSHPINSKIYNGNLQVEDLLENINKVGLLEPLVVIPKDKKNSFYVISGNRRLKALKSLGITQTDVKILNIEKKDIPFYIVSYNRTRLKKATTLLREIDILEKYYYTNKDIKNGKKVPGACSEKITGDKRKVISEKIGIGDNQISRLKTIRKIRPDLLDKIDNDEISVRQGFLMCKRQMEEENSISTNFIKGEKNKSTERINIFCKSSSDMSEIPDGKINAIITSPVFWGLRTYSNNPNELGKEKNVEDYIFNLCNIMDEYYRVLSKTGVMFIHLGDTYDKNGSLLNLPHRVIMEMLKRKPFILRNTLIFKKSNPIPNSVGTRLSNSYEFVFFLTKSNTYNFNHIRVKSKTKNKSTSPPFHRGRQNGFSPYIGDGKKNLQDYLDENLIDDIIHAPVANQIKSKNIHKLLHPCPFPEKLALTLLALVTPNITPKNTIKNMSDFHLLDGMMGMGQVLIEGYVRGMSVWGYDINSNYTKSVIKEFKKLKQE